MKNMRRIASLLLALVMVFGLATTAFADDVTGSITINDATAGRSYALYKIFDLTQSGESVSYTIDSDWVAFFDEGGDGAGYIVADDEDDEDNQNLNPIVVDDTVKRINITDDNVAAFSEAAKAYALSLSGADTTVTAGEGETTVTADDLALGYYLVYPVGAAEIKDSYNCLCSLTSTTPAATVIVKAEYPTIDKTETVPVVSGDVGSVVEYTITGEVPDTTGYTDYIYVITDNMTNLLYNYDLKITIGNEEFDFSTYEPENGAVQETLENGIAYVGYIASVNGNEISYICVSIPVEKFTAGDAITLTYSATIAEGAVVEGAKNSASLEYSNNPNTDSTEKTPVDEEFVYSSEIVVDKFDADTEETLEGAKFVLKNEDGMYYKYTEATDDEPAKVEWVDDLDDATEVVTDENGAAEFVGLADGTYYLVETEAPAGYNKMTGEMELVIEGDEDTNTGVSLEAEVPNQTGSQLPETGGMGTTLFYVFGGIMVLAAAVLLVTKKRMNIAE